RALDAATGHRPGHVAVLVHRHRRARVTRPRAIEADDPCDRDPLAGGPPPFDVVEHVLHRLITSTSDSSEANEWPSTNSSTKGRAAAIPRASGAYPGAAFRGFTHTMRWVTRARRAIWAPSTSGSPRSQPSLRMTTIAPRAIPRTPQRSLNRRNPSPNRVPPDQSVTARAAAATAASGSREESSRVMRVRD